MIESSVVRCESLVVADVNHSASRVWVSFADGRSVMLSVQQILDADAAKAGETDRGTEERPVVWAA